jgi:hypothetical protein
MGGKFKSIIKRELLYYVITLVILALIMHIDLLSDPLSRIDLMKEKENYSHPFLYSFAVYAIILIIRIIIDFFIGIFQRK